MHRRPQPELPRGSQLARVRLGGDVVNVVERDGEPHAAVGATLIVQAAQHVDSLRERVELALVDLGPVAEAAAEERADAGVVQAVE